MFKLRRKYIGPASTFILIQTKDCSFNSSTMEAATPLLTNTFGVPWLNGFSILYLNGLLQTSSRFHHLSWCLLSICCSCSVERTQMVWQHGNLWWWPSRSLFTKTWTTWTENKQERHVHFDHKKGTGSPLGMLFDHGVDSLVSFMLTLQFLEIIRLKNFNIIIPVVFIFIMATFFSALWNQYSTGVFRLGRINPVDEGLPALALTAVLFIFVSSEGFDQYHIFAPLNQEILAGMCLILAALLVSMNKDILKNSIR